MLLQKNSLSKAKQGQLILRVLVAYFVCSDVENYCLKER